MRERRFALLPTAVLAGDAHLIRIAAVQQEQVAFAEGDWVRLKTGGPLMSVRFTVAGLLLCDWADPVGRSRRGTFSAEQLEQVDPSALFTTRVLARLAQRWPVVAVC